MQSEQGRLVSLRRQLADLNYTQSFGIEYVIFMNEKFVREWFID